jgi:NAD(P)-dependent dehydrogenase (short-subunit alcohol dehydrogenase family)
MKQILIIGNSGGIGKALETAFKDRGDEVTGLSRSKDGFDITNEASVEQGLQALKGNFDIVFVATGALTTPGSRPEKSLSQLSLTAMTEQFLLNAAGPAMVLKYSKQLLRKDMPSIFAALSARVGSIGDNRLGGWYSYRAAKSALNQLIHSASIELKRTHPKSICVALHPGTVKTELTKKYVAGHPAITPDEAANHLLSVLENVSPEQSGLFFDWSGKQVEW